MGGKPVRSRPWKGSSVSETRDRAAPSHSGVWYLLHREKRAAEAQLHDGGKKNLKRKLKKQRITGPMNGDAGDKLGATGNKHRTEPGTDNTSKDFPVSHPGLRGWSVNLRILLVRA